MLKIISIDVGTTKIKGAMISIDEHGDGKPAIIESVDADQYVVRVTPEAHENSPNYILDTMKKIIAHFTRVHGKPDALSFSSYLFTMTLADDRGEYISNVITWLDERPKKILDEIKPYAKEIYRRTGVPPIYIYSLPKILYLRRYNPELLKRARYFLDSKSMITLHFLGYPITDYSTASGTYQMLNISKVWWDDLALQLAGIDEKMLPELAEGDHVEYVRSSIAREIGIEEKTPLVLSLYDGGSMIYALTGRSPGIGVVNLGTSAMIRVVHDKPIVDDADKMRFNAYYFYKRTWIPGGSTNNAGIALEYATKLLNMEGPSAFELLYKLKVEDLTSRKPRPYVLPLLYPERIPFIGKDLGMSIIGIKTFNCTATDILISTLEGIIILLWLFADAMKENSIDFKEVRAGGSITKIPLTLEILAGVLNRPVSSLDTPHISHIGNSAMALDALDPKEGAKFRKSIEAMATNNTIKPNANLVELYNSLKPIVRRYLELLYGP
uniref:Carbohydrate kinase n=1 Tax=Ignisphaera aggregans TaxID=334771 RepID=A0A7C2V8X8_9CREN